MAVNSDSTGIEPSLILSPDKKEVLWASDSEIEERVERSFEAFFSLFSEFLGRLR